MADRRAFSRHYPNTANTIDGLADATNCALLLGRALADLSLSPAVTDAAVSFAGSAMRASRDSALEISREHFWGICVPLLFVGAFRAAAFLSRWPFRHSVAFLLAKQLLAVTHALRLRERTRRRLQTPLIYVVACCSGERVGWNVEDRRAAAVLTSGLESRAVVALRWALRATVWMWAIQGAFGSHGPSFPTGPFTPRENCACRRDDHSSDLCASFTGVALTCDELARARSFNREVMPALRDAPHGAVRRAMTAHGLPGHAWEVGHACPDPSKRTSTDAEDRGWNLFAQHPADNARLGHCLVSCAEAEYLGALHVRCTDAKGCVARC